MKYSLLAAALLSLALSACDQPAPPPAEQNAAPVVDAAPAPEAMPAEAAPADAAPSEVPPAEAAPADAAPADAAPAAETK